MTEIDQEILSHRYKILEEIREISLKPISTINECEIIIIEYISLNCSDHISKILTPDFYNILYSRYLYIHNKKISAQFIYSEFTSFLFRQFYRIFHLEIGSYLKTEVENFTNQNIWQNRNLICRMIDVIIIRMQGNPYLSQFLFTIEDLSYCIEKEFFKQLIICSRKDLDRMSLNKIIGFKNTLYQMISRSKEFVYLNEAINYLSDLMMDINHKIETVQPNSTSNINIQKVKKFLDHTTRVKEIQHLEYFITGQKLTKIDSFRVNNFIGFVFSVLLLQKQIPNIVSVVEELIIQKKIKNKFDKSVDKSDLNTAKSRLKIGSSTLNNSNMKKINKIYISIFKSQ